MGHWLFLHRHSGRWGIGLYLGRPPGLARFVFLGGSTWFDFGHLVLDFVGSCIQKKCGNIKGFCYQNQ